MIYILYIYMQRYNCTEMLFQYWYYLINLLWCRLSYWSLFIHWMSFETINSLSCASKVLIVLCFLRWVMKLSSDPAHTAFSSSRQDHGMGNDILDYLPLFSKMSWGDFSFFIIFYFSMKKKDNSFSILWMSNCETDPNTYLYGFFFHRLIKFLSFFLL